MGDNRGVSDLVGFVLTVGIILTGVGIVATVGVDQVERIQGTQDVEFHVDLTNLSTGNADVTLSADSDSSNSATDVASNVVGSSNSVTLSPGDSIVLDLTVDTTGQGPASTSGTITFVAEA